MIDIVERLRKPIAQEPPRAALEQANIERREAADEIERLRGEVSRHALAAKRQKRDG